MQENLNLYKLVNKKTGMMTDFLTYEMLQNVQSVTDVKKEFYIYAITMKCCNDYIEL